jgi:hypothetical protein
MLQPVRRESSPIRIARSAMPGSQIGLSPYRLQTVRFRNADLKEHPMSYTIDKRSMARRSANGSGAMLFTLGGLAAGFGVASCCALPLLLTTIGVSTAWLGGVALLAAPHRGVLLAVGALCLTGGAALL